ncbi:hypothetical protein L1887_23733 [Cichorium endivia]|nr:hypothetical protein L1887_23733 [Cichorium endivia]
MLSLLLEIYMPQSRLTGMFVFNDLKKDPPKCPLVDCALLSAFSFTVFDGEKEETRVMVDGGMKHEFVRKFTRCGVKFSADFAAVRNFITYQKLTRKNEEDLMKLPNEKHTRLDVLVEISALLEQLLEMRLTVQHAFYC